MNIENVKFYLKRPNSSEATAIFAKVHYQGKPIKIPIGKSIHPELWDAANGQPTSDKKLINEWKKHDPSVRIVLDNISARIRKVKDAVVSFVNLSEQAGNELTPALIKNHVKESVGISERGKSAVATLNQYIGHFIEGIESGQRLTSKKQRYANGTIKNYKAFAVQFEEFQKSQNRLYDFNDIDLKFYDEFVSFFQEKDYTPNSVGRQIKHLKAIMRSAEEEGYHDNRIYTHKRFKLLSAPVDSIALTEGEIDAIAELDLSGKPTHELIRDVFLIGCHTALRYSDYKRIRPHHIVYEGDEMVALQMYTEKTDEKLIVPLKPAVKQILEKYDCSIPETIEQVVNRYLKEIGKWAGLVDNVEIIKYKGADKIRVTIPKYQLISTHTARRSAATNMVKAGISTELVRRLTGHSSEKNLLKYIRLSQKEVADLLSDTGYFSK